MIYLSIYFPSFLHVHVLCQESDKEAKVEIEPRGETETDPKAEEDAEAERDAKAEQYAVEEDADEDPENKGNPGME